MACLTSAIAYYWLRSRVVPGEFGYSLVRKGEFSLNEHGDMFIQGNVLRKGDASVQKAEVGAIAFRNELIDSRDVLDLMGFINLEKASFVKCEFTPSCLAKILSMEGIRSLRFTDCRLPTPNPSTCGIQPSLTFVVFERSTNADHDNLIADLKKAGVDVTVWNSSIPRT
ncbi:MAG: hypothetical protein AAGG48_32055 [Planctomycetota bacterium]